MINHGLSLIAVFSVTASQAIGTDIQHIHPPSGDTAMAPRLTIAPDGKVILSWMEAMPGQDVENQPRTRNRKWRLQFARFADGAWSEPRTIVQERDFFVNWADVPSVTRARDESLLAHWLESSGEDVYAYDVMLARSTDGGETWNLLGAAHDDGTETEHGFVSAVLEGDGIRLFWLDGREMAGDAAQDDEAPAHGHGHGPGDMQLRTALVNGDVIGESTVLDTRVCECCDTAATMTSKGPVVVYRDRGEGEVRDISIVRWIDGQWTSPRLVHHDRWSISGCPVNGPAITAQGDRVAVAWFTIAEMRGRVQVAFSDDGGATFAQPIELDGDDSLGRVDIVMCENGEAMVLWMRSGDGETDLLRAQRVGHDGPRSEATTVAEVMPGRQSGFPQLAMVGGKPLIVWTDAKQSMRLRAAVIDSLAESADAPPARD